jgi:GNAT superfamily N-acetyltransferase
VALIETLVLHPNSPDLPSCARWRLEAFAGVLGHSLEAELAALQSFVSDAVEQVALLASVDGAAAGTCLLVRSEIEAQHAVSPWLAGLYVVPAYRRLGVGEQLVRAIEDQARQRGHRSLHLYTTRAADYYARLGWRVIDRVAWKGSVTALMQRRLAADR